MQKRTHITSWFFFSIFLIANFSFWTHAKNIQAKWLNVPPAPTHQQADLLALGDKELAYRSIGLMLQNMGNVGGRDYLLKDFDYEMLGKWFFLMDYLDPHSDYMPFLAAHYFGSVSDPAKLDPVIDYLEVVGQRPEGEKWRWLGQAVFLARYKQEDMNKALELSYRLAAVDNPDVASWARQMPAFILQAQGDEEAAYGILVNILASSADKLHPSEVFFMTEYICEKLLTSEEAREDPICAEFNPVLEE